MRTNGLGVAKDRDRQKAEYSSSFSESFNTFPLAGCQKPGVGIGLGERLRALGINFTISQREIISCMNIISRWVWSRV